MPNNLGLGNLASTLSKDKIGILAGYLLTQMKYAQDWNQDILEVTLNNLMNVKHIPSFEGIKHELTTGSPAKTFKDLLGLGLLSLILEEVKIHPMATRWAKVGKNIGFMGAVGVGLASAVFSAGHSAHKSSSPGGNSSYGY